MRFVLPIVAWFVLVNAAGAATPQMVPLPCEARHVQISRDAGTADLLCTDGSRQVIALPSGKRLRTIAADSSVFDELIAPDGEWLVLIGKDGTIAAYATHGTGAPKIWSVRSLPGSYFFLPNGLLLIGRTLWDVPSARALHKLDADFDVINAVATNGTRTATAGADTTVRAYDNAGWKPLFTSRSMEAEPFGIAYTNDGRRLVVGGADYRVSVLDAASGRLLKASSFFKDYINDIEALAASNWVAIQFGDARNAAPSYWRQLNLDSGDVRDLCGNAVLVRFRRQEALCFTQEGRAMRIDTAPLPSD